MGHFEEFGVTTSPAQNNIIAFSLSYFVFETSYCLIAQTEDIAMLLHHFVSLSALTWSRGLGTSGYEVCLLIWSAEFTNPFLQLRWFLRSVNYHSTLVGRVNEVLFVVLFVALRGGFGMVYTYRLYEQNKTEFVLRYFGYAFQLVNFLFLYQVGRMVYRKLFRGRAQKGDEKSD